MLVLIGNLASIIAFVSYDAQNLLDYANGAYEFATTAGLSIDFLILIWQSAKFFKFIKILENLIQESKCTFSSVKFEIKTKYFG